MGEKGRDRLFNYSLKNERNRNIPFAKHCIFVHMNEQLTLFLLECRILSALKEI